MINDLRYDIRHAFRLLRRTPRNTAIAIAILGASILTEVGPVDVAILAGAALPIVATAGVACLVPAVAAARLDPVQALKAD